MQEHTNPDGSPWTPNGGTYTNLMQPQAGAAPQADKGFYRYAPEVFPVAQPSVGETAKESWEEFSQRIARNIGAKKQRILAGLQVQQQLRQ